jgi:hypothetical protein
MSIAVITLRLGLPEMLEKERVVIDQFAQEIK